MKYKFWALVIFFLMVIVVICYQTTYSSEDICTDRTIGEMWDSKVAERLADRNKLSNLNLDNLSKLQNIELHKQPGIETTKNANQSINGTQEYFSAAIDYTNKNVSTVRGLWKGLNIFSAADCIKKRPVNPPDVTIGVSKNHVAQMVHNGIQVWDKTGKPLIKESLYDFFNVSRSNYITDPEILYDNSSGNWFATIVDGGKEQLDNKTGLSYWSCKPVCKVVLVKSSNDDPTQNRSSIHINATMQKFFPDEPKIAVNKFNLFMTTTEFNITSGAENHFYTYMINKDFRDVFHGKPYDILPLWTDQHFAVPERNPSNCTSTVALVKDNPLDEYSNVSSIKIFNFCYQRPVGSPYGPYSVSLPTHFKLMPAKSLQPLINQSDLKISSGMRDNDSVWIGLHAECQTPGFSNTSCVRILKFDYIPAEDNYNLGEDTQFNINDTDLYYPTIGISKDGKLFFVSGFSNSNIFPSLDISHLVSENQTEGLYRVFGSYINNSTRYGDYFGSAIDPIDGSVWLSGQYVDGSISIPVPLEFEDIPNVREKTWSTIIANIS